MIDIDCVDKNCMARTGTLHLAHGTLSLPAFMPVGTNGAIRAMFHNDIKTMGYNLILGNTYHLFLRPGIDVIAQYGGLHQFSSWDGNILTDSGGYQVFSLSPFRKISEEGVSFRSHIDGSTHFLTPESVVDIQCVLNSDIQMPLDVCTPPDIDKKNAHEALQLTTQWALRAKHRWLESPATYDGKLFGIVQGNFFESLRKESAMQLEELDLPGYAIGGLSVGEPPEVFKDFIAFTAPLLPDNKPKYVMGIGTPDYILEAVQYGIDMFDCVYPTRIARNGTCFTFQGMLNLKNSQFRKDVRPIVEDCSCKTCRNYSRGYIRHLLISREILAPMLVTLHNLHFISRMMNDVRHAIRHGQFLQYKNQFLENFSSQSGENDDE